MNNKAVPAPLRRGRGARSNAASRYEPIDHAPMDDGWEGLGHVEGPRTQTIALTPKSMITRNASPDLGFEHTLNPYKGCEHGCIYCYARPNHAYLGYSPGLDFETTIFIKPNAAALLERELARPGHTPSPLVIGGDTDPYQPVERRLETTRQILHILSEAGHPCGLVTKSALVVRDLDILTSMALRGLVRVAVSLTTLDPKLARDMEPRAATPAKRLKAVHALAEASVPVRLMTAPMIPGLNDHELERLLEAGANHGATSAGYVLLRLPLEIKDLFQEWLTDVRPDAAKKIISLIRSCRDGADYDARWFVRGRGTGPYARLIAERFAAAVQRYKLNTPQPPLRRDLFRPPRRDGQGDLFEDPASNHRLWSESGQRKMMVDFSFEQHAPGPCAGVDEAGRGPAAGPVTAAAVAFVRPRFPEGLDGLGDSKKLTARRRDALYGALWDCVERGEAQIGVGLAEPEEIDRLNILHATFKAMARAVDALPSPPAHALIDGNRSPKLACSTQTLIGGDGRSASIAAASIIAKVTRDRLMDEAHESWPQYGFDRHKGYLTAQHTQMLKRYGPCPLHRRSFAPVRAAIPRLSATSLG